MSRTCRSLLRCPRAYATATLSVRTLRPLHPRPATTSTPRTSPLSTTLRRTHTHTHTHTPSTTTKTCPSCSARLAAATSPCPECKHLVPIPSDISYYALFGLADPSAPRDQSSRVQGGGYVVDVRELRARYLRRQQGCHPDSYSGQGKVYDLALEQSSFLNKAYSTLADPLSRAQYLLEIYGNPIAETDSLDDPELLMDVMEAREQLEEAQTEEQVEEVKRSNDGYIQATMQGLAEAFGQDPPDLERAKSLAIELQYLKNLERAAREWQPGKRVEVVH